jgi:hypothetical protein
MPFLFETNARPFPSVALASLHAHNLPCLSLWATTDTVIPVEIVAYNDRHLFTGLQHVFLNNLSFFCRRSISAQCGHASPTPDPHAPLSSSPDVSILS